MIMIILSFLCDSYPWLQLHRMLNFQDRQIHFCNILRFNCIVVIRDQYHYCFCILGVI